MTRRPTCLLPSDTVAQALAAVHGAPHVAYHEKAKIWLNDHVYTRFFNEHTTAEHIVWCYSLLKAIDSKKTELVHRESMTNDLAEDQRDALDFLRRRGATILLTGAIANCIETILDRRVPNLFRVSFGKDTSPAKAEELWQPIIEIAMPLAPLQLSESLTRGIDRGDQTKKNVKQFASMIRATAQVNKSILQTFASRVTVSK